MNWEPHVWFGSRLGPPWQLFLKSHGSPPPDAGWGNVNPYNPRPRPSNAIFDSGPVDSGPFFIAFAEAIGVSNKTLFLVDREKSAGRGTKARTVLDWFWGKRRHRSRNPDRVYCLTLML